VEIQVRDTRCLGLIDDRYAGSGIGHAMSSSTGGIDQLRRRHDENSLL
jgi:hypothetical protein